MNKLLLIQPNALLKKFYSKATWHYDREAKVIYLTFDDGPIPGLTEWVLDVLKRFNASATFFCVGSNILRHRAIFERIKAEGHVVGNHTMFHTKGFKTSKDAYISEASQCSELVGNMLFRPPYGQMKPSQYKALIGSGYHIILWDVISYDYEGIPSGKCADNVLKNARNGSVVLFHDNIKAEKNLRYALPKFLETFSEMGYEFRSIPA